MDFEVLKERSARKVGKIDTRLVRSIMQDIEWNWRLIGIKGARGIGKTTLLLQRLKLLNLPVEDAMYASCDDIWFSEHRLVGLADAFSKRGGKYLFLDEVHKYPNWSQELKNIYDDFPELKIVFTGSSLLEILNARADLSRRAITYNMQGLSLREYLTIETQQQIPLFKLDEILNNHTEIAKSLVESFRPIRYFGEYLLRGYYPFYRESEGLYYQRIEEVINLMLYIELPLLRKIDMSYVFKIKQLLQIIAEASPFVPNVSKLSERIGVNRNTFISYLYYLHESGITHNLFKNVQGITRLQKPDKIYLENPNLHYTLGLSVPNKGHVRECFFLNQLTYKHQVEYVDAGDFKIDGTYTFELGGKSKNPAQLRKTKNSFVVADEIEIGTANRIPLWLFGFLY
jgi:predicted AAA+ superfamily ATPase